MSSVDQLLLILLAIYFSECLLYLRDGAVAVGRWFGRWQAIANGLPVGKSGGELALLSLLPWEFSCVGEAWPIAVSDEGVVSIAGWPGAVTPSDVVTAIAWTDVQSTGSSGRWLYINETRFAECGSVPMAIHLARLLKKLRSANPAERDNRIRAALAMSADLRTSRERLSEVSGELRYLRFGATMMFLIIFALVPILDRTLAIWSWVFWLAGAVVVQAIVNLRAMRRVMKACGELNDDYRFKSSLVAAVSPVSSMRCLQTAAAHLIPLHHPLAIAVTIGSPEFIRSIAGQVWRELHFPIALFDSDTDSLANRVSAAYSTALIAAIEPLIRSCCIDPATLLAPPEPDSPDVVAYCPRCLGQFNTVEGRCQSCGDRTVVPLR